MKKKNKYELKHARLMIRKDGVQIQRSNGTDLEIKAKMPTRGEFIGE